MVWLYQLYAQATEDDVTAVVYGHRTETVDQYLGVLDTTQTQYRTHVYPGTSTRYLHAFHHPDYVREVLSGWSEEWVGSQPHAAEVELGRAAAAGGAAALLFRGVERRIVLPDGGHTLAGPATGDRGCVFNDVALFTAFLARRQLRTLLVDISGVHAAPLAHLAAHDEHVTLVSIHDADSGPDHDLPLAGVYNYAITPHPIRGGADQLMEATAAAADLVTKLTPDVVVLIAGADGHFDSDATGLRYGYVRYHDATLRLAVAADQVCGGRIVVTGGPGANRNPYAGVVLGVATAALAVPYAAATPRPTDARLRVVS